ncbi:methyltransferase domain-containing protein [Ferruginivarius sediminum]|uniref:Methyltransferase domain-containing protein n=1 Tax=Ferruginivarius sediminum TaxID=2661937 RepID=A0A369TD20_9PROT|nr:methyltransferase domain-containing protein [Ferruginivarius sediminum]
MRDCTKWKGKIVKILVAIANYGTKNVHLAEKLINTYRNFKHDVDIVVLSNIDKDFGDNVDVRVGLPSENPWSLPFAHRPIFVDRKDDYDLFIYSEDDTEIKEEHIDAFLKATEVLPADKIAGFIRYEIAEDGTTYYSTVHGRYYWDPNSVFQAGGYTFARYTNDHAASYILTRQQLHRCIESGGYAITPHEGRYDMLCSAATDPYTRCGLAKVIPISHLPQFRLRHLSDVYLGRIGIEKQEVDRQIEKLLSLVQQDGEPRGPLFNPRPRLDTAEFDKRYFQPYRQDIIDALPRGARRVLSIGCERGLSERRLIELGHEVTAVPLDCVIAESAKMRGIEVLPADYGMASETLGDRRFDALLFNNVLQYVEQPEDLIRKFLKHVAPGGIVVAESYNFAHVSLRMRRYKGDPVARRLNGHATFADTGIHTVSGAGIRQWFKAAGLQPQRISYQLEGREARLSKYSLGTVDPWLGRRFVALAARGNGVPA